MGTHLADRRGLRGRAAPLAAALVAAGAPLAGCGKQEERDVRMTVEAFYSAVAANEGEKACARLVPEERARLERGGRSCPEVIAERARASSRAGVGSITIRGDEATASVTAATQQGVVRLRKVDDAWRIVRGYDLR